VITVSGLAKAHGGRTLFSDVTFRLMPGRRVALVGGNGVGKTTILEIIVGDQEADSGEVHSAKGTRIGYLPQELTEQVDGTVLEEVMRAVAHVTDLEDQMARLLDDVAATAPGGPLEETDAHEHALHAYGEAQHRFETLGGYGIEAEGRRVLAGLGFTSQDMDRPVRDLSGGWRMRVALARLMLSAPDLLVLDEPTNHLDVESVAWLERYLADWPGAILFVSHDRDFIDAVAERVIEVSGGRALEYVGGFAEFVVQREERLAGLRAAQAQQQRQVEHLEQFIDRFRYKATKARQVQSRIKLLDRLDRIEMPDRAEQAASFAFPKPQRSSRVVIEVDDATVGFEGTPVLSHVDLVVERGAKLALIGPNGAGKTTLLRMILGELEPDSGTATLGANVDVAHFTQHQVDTLRFDRTVLEELRAAVGEQQGRNLRSVLGGFGFSGDAVDRKVGDLSGGERTRLALARMMVDPVNLLVLDEPTNHLDLPSCDVLEDALIAYPGTVLLVTHDRYLIREVATGLVVVKGGRAVLHDGVDEELLTPSGTTAAAAPATAVAPGSPERPKANGSKTISGAKVATDTLATAETGGTDDPGRRENRAEVRKREAVVRQRSAAENRDVRKRVQRLERQVAKAEAEVARIGAELADPEIYDDHQRVRALADEHDMAKERAQSLMTQWLSAQEELETTGP
jgi:ATP-binding cassette subfamily F protein 3